MQRRKYAKKREHDKQVKENRPEQIKRWQRRSRHIKEIIECECGADINDDRNGVMLKQKNILITWDETLKSEGL